MGGGDFRFRNRRRARRQAKQKYEACFSSDLDNRAEGSKEAHYDPAVNRMGNTLGKNMKNLCDSKKT